MHPAALTTEDLLKDCSAQTGRRGGPGGQHRNKVETAVILLHGPTGIQAEANERRSQAANHRVALIRLRLKLACEIRTDATACSTLWQSRSRNGRISVSDTHEDFPAILAEALDQVAAADFDLSVAAGKLAVSSSQLVKLLRNHPPALKLVNAQREQLGLRKLR
ncbi:MAG: peptide chain release factor-like protein [Aureliella sp.]